MTVCSHLLVSLIPRRTVSKVAVALTALTLLAPAPPARAQIIYDAGGPLRTYQWGGVLSDLDPYSSPFLRIDKFTLTGTSTFDTIQWWGGYGLAKTAPATDAFSIRLYNMTTDVLYAANGGIYPLPFASFTPGDAVNRTADGIAVSTTNGYVASLYRYTATLPAFVTLAPGTYALSVYNDTDDDWFWSNSTDEGETYSRREVEEGAFSNIQSVPGGRTAFNLQNSTVAAPEPGSGALAVSGILGATLLIGRTGRQRRGNRTAGK